MSRGRAFGREFKPAAGRRVEAGERPARGCREHGLAATVPWRRRRGYAARGEAAFGAPEPPGPWALERRTAALERFGGRLAPGGAARKSNGLGCQRATA